MTALLMLCIKRLVKMSLNKLFHISILVLYLIVCVMVYAGFSPAIWLTTNAMGLLLIVLIRRWYENL
jgi:Flp pilus assembly protein TadB